MQRVIGIDFGTSTTYMNVKRYNNGKPVEDKFSYMPVVFNYGESSGFVMSIVRENSDGTFDFGEKAAEPLDGARVYIEFKMRLESPDEEERGEARRITKEFFKFLYESYAQQANNLGSPDDTEETLVSYPVKWREETAQFMLEATREAGFQNVRGIDEASSAVSTVLCQSTDDRLLRSDKPGYLMLIDMGAGTTDLVVCRYEADPGGDGISIELVTIWPQSAEEPTFGGREIDAALEGYVEGYLARGFNPVLSPQAGAIAGAPGQAKLWKERNVSVNLGAGRTVDTCAYISIYKTTGMLNGDFPAFGRKEFETFIGSGLRDYSSLLMGCLDMASACDGDFSASGLDLVILTGGHSAWYFAREIVDGTMAGYLDHPMLDAVRRDKTRVIGLPNPQSTVSLGLVYSKLPLYLAKPEPKEETKLTEESKPKEETKNEEEPFLIFVEDIFEITGRGTVITGIIQSGSVKLNDKVFLRSQNGIVKTAFVRGIEMDRKLHETACKGDSIGLLLGDIRRNDIRKGDMIINFLQSALGNEARLDTDEEFGFRSVGGNHEVEINRNSSETYVLTIVREIQYYAEAVKIKIIVDDSETHKLASGSSMQILLSPGRHKIAFSLPFAFAYQNTTVYITVGGDMTLNVRFGKITCKIEVYRNGIKL